MNKSIVPREVYGRSPSHDALDAVRELQQFAKDHPEEYALAVARFVEWRLGY